MAQTNEAAFAFSRHEGNNKPTRSTTRTIEPAKKTQKMKKQNKMGEKKPRKEYNNIP
jgi:hypothetical protein